MTSSTSSGSAGFSCLRTSGPRTPAASCGAAWASWSRLSTRQRRLQCFPRASRAGTPPLAPWMVAAVADACQQLLTRLAGADSTSDDYFMGSGGKIRYFFEEDAFAEDGSLKGSFDQSINKVGHGPSRHRAQQPYLHALQRGMVPSCSFPLRDAASVALCSDARPGPRLPKALVLPPRAGHSGLPLQPAQHSAGTNHCQGRASSAIMVTPRPSEHVHLQAAAHRRRGHPAPGRHLPRHRAAVLRRPVVVAGGLPQGQRVPLGRARLPQR